MVFQNMIVCKLNDVGIYLIQIVTFYFFNTTDNKHKMDKTYSTKQTERRYLMEHNIDKSQSLV